jgi:hypothetical protein
MGPKVQSENLWSPKTEFVGHEIFISRVTYPSIRNFMLSLKKIYFMGSEMQPGVMRDEKREIQISRVKKILYLV